MRFTETKVMGAWVIDPSPHEDNRGRFMRAWCAREFAKHGIEFLPVQANLGFSERKGTVRGMHYQEAPALEAKLIRCTRGAMFDVVLDLRP
jgi:dTDP-4-dehydrorhamnose 3,5-epimerase